MMFFITVPANFVLVIITKFSENWSIYYWRKGAVFLVTWDQDLGLFLPSMLIHYFQGLSFVYMLFRQKQKNVNVPQWNIYTSPNLFCLILHTSTIFSLCLFIINTILLLQIKTHFWKIITPQIYWIMFEINRALSKAYIMCYISVFIHCLVLNKSESLIYGWYDNLSENLIHL
jgi:hypothetical protein